MTNQELEKIYTESYRAVYWTAMSLLKNETDAEDIVQETFLSLIKSYDSIQDKSKVNSWLKKTAANKCLDRIKLTKTVNVDDEVLKNIETVPEDFLPDSLVESEDTRRIVMDIIEKALSEDVRRTIILFYFDEMSTKEIAEAMGIPQGTVLWRLNFARNKIKKEVEKYEKDTRTKLFAVPFLTNLFIKEAEQVPFKPMPASLLNLLSASTEAAAKAAGSKLAAKAITKGTGFIMKKSIFASVAVVLVGVSTAGIVYLATRKEDKSATKKNAKQNAENEVSAIDPEEDTTTAPEGDENANVITTDDSGATTVAGDNWTSYSRFYLNGVEIDLFESTIQDLSNAGCYIVCEGYDMTTVPAQPIYYSLDDIADGSSLYHITAYPDKASADASTGGIKISWMWPDFGAPEDGPIRDYIIIGMSVTIDDASSWNGTLTFDFPLTMTSEQLVENAGAPVEIYEDDNTYLYYSQNSLQLWFFTFDENGRLTNVFAR